jgi:hypothetical protein
LEPTYYKDEGENMFVKKEMKAVFMIALLCFTLSMTSSAMPDTHLLSSAAENSVVGGSQCDDFINGFAVGMGVATFLGCVWCPVAGFGAKALQLFICGNS